MAVTNAFLALCRTGIGNSAELSAFNTAYANYASATTDANGTQGKYWQLAYGDAQVGLSPAYRLRKLIRDTVQAQADADVTVGSADRQSAYTTLVAQYCPEVAPPTPYPQQAADLQQAILDDMLS